MKITRLTTYPVPRRSVFLRVDTDEGVVGWGEPTLEGRAHTMRAAIEELSDYLVGQDPLRIEEHWQVLTKGGFYRGGPVLSSAVAGVDQALWDIAGKVHGVPVHELLGGHVRDRMRIYGWIHGDSPEAVAAAARSQQERGLTAIKLNASDQLRRIDTAGATEAIAARIAAIREACGPEFDIAIDFHGRLTVAMARRALPLLEPYLPLFVEEPLVPEMSDHIGDICSSTTIPIATGERLFSRWDFKRVLGTGLAIVQPDLSHAGGISEVRRIAAMAEAYDVSMAPHCPLGPIALAASLQVDFASPNALIQEQSLNVHHDEGSDLLDYLADTSVFDFADGYLARPTGPGLGIEIDEAAVKQAAETGYRWDAPLWRRDDGSLAEW